MSEFISRSIEETIDLGKQLYQKVPNNTVICFFGDLAAGKTTMIKGIAQASGVSEEIVNSPTFVYLNIYEGQRTIYHFDLYRLRDADEFLGMGFDEVFDQGGICCIEWSEKISQLLPENTVKVFMRHAESPEGEKVRHIAIEGIL